MKPSMMFVQTTALLAGAGLLTACADDALDLEHTARSVVGEVDSAGPVGAPEASAGSDATTRSSSGPASSAATGITYIWTKQGPRLLDAADARLELAVGQLATARFDGVGAPGSVEVGVDDVGLAVTGADGERLESKQLVGLAIDATARDGSAVTFIIDGGRLGDAAGRHRYRVIARRPDGSKAPLCPDDDSAYAVRGMFNELGEYSDGDTSVVFACRRSAAAKAVRWGYKPSIGPTWVMAATRLARADYCGTGQSHTLPDTQVLVYDRQGHVAAAVEDDEAPPPAVAKDAAPFAFEAGWSGDKHRGAVCLSKARWQTFALGGPCPQVLPDPRLANSGGFYCEDLTSWTGTWTPGSASSFLEALEAQGALTFSESQVNDKGLWTWRKGKDHYSTTSGFYADDLHSRREPAGGDGYALVEWLGTVFTAKRDKTVPLYHWYNPSTKDHLTSTLDTGVAPWERREIVGYVHAMGTPAAVRGNASILLVTAWNAANSDFRLFALRPGFPGLPAGYVAVRYEGYAIR
jgi:hypothetical protein